ncbi:DUF4160 domain-containing protein [Granulicella tundricola]|uniref:DUF4160 domain-containing protein n=1 Tax=Granulicella tundricola TaxID=940615 RepID=UPI000A0027F9
MPAITRFRGLNIGIYTADHRPAHVHVEGAGLLIVFYLNCWTGPVAIRESYGANSKTEKQVANFLNENLQLLCTAWENFHGDPT